MDLPSGMVLYQYLRVTHPHDRPYHCHDCAAHYNNMKKLSSHRSNVHCAKLVLCTQCDYKVTSKVKLRQHICCHMQGLLCEKCGKSFPTISELSQHEHFHDEREVFECEQCGVEYYTMASLRLHVVGKHGEGYCCEKCNLRFDTLSQCLCHRCTCQ